MVDVIRYGNSVTITATDSGDGAFVPIPGTDQTSDLNTYLNTALHPQLQSGSAFRITAPYPDQPILDLTARTGGVIEGNGSILQVVWDPTSDATIAATLKDVIRIRDWSDVTIRGVTIDYFPKTYAKGPVTAVTGSTITFRPDGPIAFKNADKLEREDGITGAITDWQVYRNNDRTSNPGALSANGDGTYTFSPPSITATIASVDQYGSSTSPLVLYVPGNGVTDGQQVTINVPPGSSFYTLVNGNTYTAHLGRYSDAGGDDDDNSDYLRIYSLNEGTPLDASGAQTFVSGTITGLGKPTWVAVGDVVKLNVRKRSGNIFNVYRTKRCRFDIRAAQATGLVSGGLDNDSPTFERLSFSNGSAGGFLWRDTAGTITFDGPATFTNLGDNAFNFPTTAWDSYVTAYADVGGFATYTVSAWSNGDPGPTRPRRPVVGQLIEITDPTGLAPTLRRVKAVADTTVTLDGTFPAGYFPATIAAPGWVTVNRGYVHKHRATGLITIDGCATAGCLIQTNDADYSAGFIFRRVRAECIRMSSPSSARPIPYGWGDGVIFGTITMEYCGHKLYPSNGSGIVMRRMGSTGLTLTAPPSASYTRIPALIARHIGYSVVRVFNTRLSIGVYYGESVNERSDPNANSFLNPTKTALYAGNNGVITVDSTASVPTTLSETGGTITLPPSAATVAGKLDKTGGTLTGPLTLTQFNLASSADLTIASDAITVTGSFHRLSPEGGAAADDLVTINGGTTIGQTLTLMALTGVITVRNTGNITVSGPSTAVLAVNRTLSMRWDGTKWQEIVRNNRGGPAFPYATNASLNINVSAYAPEFIVIATLTAAINVGLAKSGSPAVGDLFTVTNRSTGGFNVVVRDNNGVGTILSTLIFGQSGSFWYDGTNWQFLR